MLIMHNIFTGTFLQLVVVRDYYLFREPSACNSLYSCMSLSSSDFVLFDSEDTSIGFEPLPLPLEELHPNDF